jgi:hypothetical protein
LAVHDRRHAQRYLQPHLSVELVDVPCSSSISYDGLRADKPLGIITRLENKTHDLDRTHATIADLAANVSAEADRARTDYGQPFPHHQAGWRPASAAPSWLPNSPNPTGTRQPPRRRPQRPPRRWRQCANAPAAAGPTRSQRTTPVS